MFYTVVVIDYSMEKEKKQFAPDLYDSFYERRPLLVEIHSSNFCRGVIECTCNSITFGIIGVRWTLSFY